jgi:pyridoxal 5'-phosphate synthase pdxT subunit
MPCPEQRSPDSSSSSPNAAGSPVRDATIGVLALQGDVGEHTAILQSLGALTRPVRMPSDLDDVDALVLPGGESTTLQLLIESGDLRDPLAERFASGMPALGTCAGMILLASTISDGRADQKPFSVIDIAVRRNGYGRQLASFEATLDPVGLEGFPIHGVFIRAPVIEEVGAGVEVLVTLAEDSGPRAVACRQGVITVCAFHPELSGETRLHERLVADARAG